MSTSPKVSVGMPVFNGESTVSQAIESILNQTFSDLELIISDNCSTDATAAICHDYAKKDSRVRYIRQPKNIGAVQNFRFVLKESTGLYFMWAAADDSRSLDFIDVNVRSFESSPSLSASASPNCFDGEATESSKSIRFSLDGSVIERYVAFLKNAWVSHGIFYSLMRRSVISDYDNWNKSFAAHDWAINMFMLSRGEIRRSGGGLVVIGKNGVSNRGNPWASFRGKKIEVLFPLFQFTKYCVGLSRNLNSFEKFRFFWALMKINITAMRSNFMLSLKHGFKST
jgi:glycosyltransferase involved in cell wall biosynthesis